MARALGQAGAMVVVNGRSEETLAASLATLRAEGIACAGAPFDVADPAAGRTAVEAIVAEHGRLDVLIANAGLVNRAPLGEWTIERVGRGARHQPALGAVPRAGRMRAR